MTNVGIVAEYNPFHTGHAYQISRTRDLLGDEVGVVVAMSGNWVQQASCAIFDKWTRARIAILGGADLVLELPTPYATASAEPFCRGAVDILAATGVVTHLSFGSEGGDVSALQQVADAIDAPQLQELLRGYLGEGLSFPAARQRAVEMHMGGGASLLASPNNTLGIEYLRAITARGYDITPVTVLRRGGGHNSIPTAPTEFTSATDLRHHLWDGDWAYVSQYLPAGGEDRLRPCSIAKLDCVERAILAKIRTMTAGDWTLLPDSGEEEGLPQRLEKAGRTARSMEEFLEAAKTKRYTHARLRRLVLCAFLGLTREERPEKPPYLRVLAFNDRGRAILKEMKDRATRPILTKSAQWESLPLEGQRMFQLECRCTDLYTLCMEEVGATGLEYTNSAIYVR